MESILASYVGMVTGVIGTISGIFGSVLGYKAYRATNAAKESDRRLELHKMRNAAHVAGVQLIELLPQAFQSRQAVNAARGLLNSGVMNSFRLEHEQDSRRAVELVKEIPGIDETFDALSKDLLDREIIDMDRLMRWIDELLNKYQATLAEDEKSRAEIRSMIGGSSQ